MYGFLMKIVFSHVSSVFLSNSDSGSCVISIAKTATTNIGALIHATKSFLKESDLMG